MSLAYIAFPIFQPSGRLTRGVPYEIDDNDIARCPLCSADLTDEYIPGYGLAYGGFGNYWYCTSDATGFTRRWSDLTRIEVWKEVEPAVCFTMHELEQ